MCDVRNGSQYSILNASRAPHNTSHSRHTNNTGGGGFSPPRPSLPLCRLSVVPLSSLPRLLVRTYGSRSPLAPPVRIRWRPTSMRPGKTHIVPFLDGVRYGWSQKSVPSGCDCAACVKEEGRRKKEHGRSTKKNEGRTKKMNMVSGQGSHCV